jgi:hypothetical protein
MQEDDSLSDLASGCKYLTSERLCLVISENDHEKARRQVQCKNVEKMTCCYLCMFVLGCAMPCQIAGNSENEPQQIDNKVRPINNAAVAEQKPKEVDKTENVSVTCCSACNSEMLQTRTKFAIEATKDPPQKSANDNSRLLSGGKLAVIVNICPKCGKIDLKVEEKLDKN